MDREAPIGIFDSGLGGLTVAAAVHALLPSEDILFYGDSAHAPYGIKSPEAVRERCFTIGDHLLDQGAKAIVIACNTATSVCVDDLRKRYKVPVVGMEPALKLACDRGGGRPQRIIVAATPLTLKEDKFARLMARFQADHTIMTQPCPDLVTIVESGRLDDPDAIRQALDRYFGGYDLTQVDSIVLGCTHFVFYRRNFERYCPSSVAIVDGNEGTARHLRDLLEERGALNQATSRGRVAIGNSDPSPRLESLSRQLFKRLS
ncbi:glutamate racemase [Bifidobacterium actinocoloniiforme DSM 22766]|uniref:Glutamate racemase n=1 Tax=Bifidobacterium actinocoloniiforme DSM 22766 TaxID=1437605 RepID=A0A086YZM2_9BIFI|nr:glutamate racemase [Bifidobacterium actinocoloniiforme]AKV55032.1 glutamate racemase [Bifidobacterium actinocoloniiforme DSM 22766]KFI39722.1 glutamate racemase [Bifidobacterium actinocoloniiforme DSM 22766]